MTTGRPIGVFAIPRSGTWQDGTATEGRRLDCNAKSDMGGSFAREQN